MFLCPTTAGLLSALCPQLLHIKHTDPVQGCRFLGEGLFENQLNIRNSPGGFLVLSMRSALLQVVKGSKIAHCCRKSIAQPPATAPACAQPCSSKPCNSTGRANASATAAPAAAAAATATSPSDGGLPPLGRESFQGPWLWSRPWKATWWGRPRSRQRAWSSSKQRCARAPAGQTRL